MNLFFGTVLLAWLLYFCAFIVADVYQLAREQAADFPVCAGCTKGAVIPGCEVHDPQERRTPLAENSDAVPSIRGTEGSSLGR